MEVRLAKTAGFCFGVKRAVETVYEQVKECQREKIYTYGPIIHNDEVVKDMKSQGVHVVSNLEQLDSLEKGINTSLLKNLDEQGIDLSCFYYGYLHFFCKVLHKKIRSWELGVRSF